MRHEETRGERQASTDACESEVTATVVIGKVTEVCPAGMVTVPGTVRVVPSLDAGTVTAALLDLSLTVRPPAGTSPVPLR
jgi:hypothetical protein